MVDALVSGASVERRVGSTPILGTEKVVIYMTTFFIFRLSRLMPAAAVHTRRNRLGLSTS